MKATHRMLATDWTQATAELLRGGKNPAPSWDDGRWRELTDWICPRGLAGLALASGRIPEEAPTDVRQRLRVSALSTAAANLIAIRGLEVIISSLSHAGIPCLLLKGAALQLTTYRRPELRPMSDLDILVPLRHAQDAQAVLVASGCSLGPPLVQPDFFPRFHYERELWGPAPDRVRIDLHARPFRPLSLADVIPDDGMWHSARTVAVGRESALIASATLQLLHLSAHAGFHGCSRLIWLLDLLQVQDREGSEVDWDLFCETAGRWRVAAACRLAFAACRRRFGESCPAHVEQELQARESIGQRFVVWQSPRDAGRPTVHVLTNVLFMRGVRARIDYMRAVLFPSADHFRQAHDGAPIEGRRGSRLRALGDASARGLGLLLKSLVAFSMIPVRRAVEALGAATGVAALWARKQCVEVRRSEIHGQGLFAARRWAPGERIGTYSGKRRLRGGRYTIHRRDKKGRVRHIELAPPFRFMNHADSPNARIVMDSNIVTAILRISPGEEITIHYGMSWGYCTDCGFTHWTRSLQGLNP